jgi:hypothetical protein
MMTLLTFLFSFFVESAKIEKKLDKARMCMTARAHLQTRLQLVFTSIDKSALESYFYTKMLGKEPHLSLIVLFDNGIDPEPSFSGTVLGKIYLDTKRNLCLCSWPLSAQENQHWRNEILFSKVKDFEFEFFGENSPEESGVKEMRRPLNANLTWRSHWPKSIHNIPSMIQLKVYEEETKEPTLYTFLLPVADCITYRGNKAI